MKTEAEVQRAHDIMVAAILKEIPVPMTENDRKYLGAQASGMCWMLGHDHNPAFAENLEKIERWAAENGYALERRQN